MDREHHFTIKIEPDLLRAGRSRWLFCESGQTRSRSELSYATKREAMADATKLLDKQIALWRADR